MSKAALPSNTLSEWTNAPDHHCFSNHLLDRRGGRSWPNVVRERWDEWKHGRIDVSWDRVASHTIASRFTRTDSDAEWSNRTEPFKLRDLSAISDSTWHPRPSTKSNGHTWLDGDHTRDGYAIRRI